MQSKLTLRMESDLIERAKKIAEERNTSVSKLVADYFWALTSADGASAVSRTLPPRTESLHGVLRDANDDDIEASYGRFLEEKYH